MILLLAHKIRPFRSSVSGLRWLCWSREILMASIAYSRTDPCVFISQKRNSCVFSLLGNNTEYPSSASVYLLGRDMKGQTSHWLRVSHRMLPLINLTSSSLLSHRLWMPKRVYVSFKCLIILNIILATLHIANFHHTCGHRKTQICFILHLHVCHYLAPGSIEELLYGGP